MSKKLFPFALLVMVCMAIPLFSQEKSEIVHSRLILFCGAGIRLAAEAVNAEFEKETGMTVDTMYAGSDKLFGQITGNRRGDLFMPGEDLYVKKAVEDGLAELSTRRTVAYFVPVLLVQRGNPGKIVTMDDLKRKGLRVGFGDPRACAVGKTTLKILGKYGIFREDINVVYESATVNELAQAVDIGSIDAAVVWDATARQYPKNCQSLEIPAEKNEISEVPVIMLKSSALPDAAKKYIEFISSSRGNKIFEDNGYKVKFKEEGKNENKKADKNI